MEHASKNALQKIPTCIRGLDDILLGGVPRGRTTLINGGPGTGKTVLGMEFLYRGALAGEAGLFISFEEREPDLRINAAGMGMDLSALEADGTLKVIHAEAPRHGIRSGDFDVNGLLSIIEGHSRALGASRIVIDAIDMLMSVFDDLVLERRALETLHNWLREHGFTSLLTLKAGDEKVRTYPFLDFMTDCVLLLDQRMQDQVRTRRLQVIKYRGSGFLSNEYPYVLSDRGMAFLPISSVQLSQQVCMRRLSSGCPELDQILGGGYLIGSSVLISGASGTGKTTLACTTVEHACHEGMRTLFIDFEQSESVLKAEMQSVGIDLDPALANGLLRVLSTLPEAEGADMHLFRIVDEIEVFRPDVLVVDALSACERMGSEAAAFDFLLRLIILCRTRGITALFTNQTWEHTEAIQIGAAGMSSLIDTLVTLRYDDDGTAVHRRLLVIKSRGSKHSLHHHELRISADGISLAAPGG